MRGSRASRECRLLLRSGVDLLHQAALLAGCLIRVDDALGGSHVEALDGEAEGLWVLVGADRVIGLLQTGANLALGRAVARGRLRVGEDALLLALDVCHVE